MIVSKVTGSSENDLDFVSLCLRPGLMYCSRMNTDTLEMEELGFSGMIFVSAAGCSKAVDQ